MSRQNTIPTELYRIFRRIPNSNDISNDKEFWISEIPEIDFEKCREFASQKIFVFTSSSQNIV